MTLYAWLNGEAFTSSTEQGLLLDRSNSFGDGVFETMLMHGGQVHLLERHLQRLSAGLVTLGLVDDDSLDAFLIAVRDDIQRACGTVRQLASGQSKASYIDSSTAVIDSPTYVIKVLISRGASVFGYSSQGLSVNRRLLMQAYQPVDDTGRRVMICQTRLGSQPQLAGIKHCNRLEQVLAKREVQLAGFDDGLVCDQRGMLCESTAANIFVLEQGQLVTPAIVDCGVAGVMRDYIVSTIAPKLGIAVQQETISLQRLGRCEGLALSNAVQGFSRVSSLQLSADQSIEWPVSATLAAIAAEVKASIGLN